MSTCALQTRDPNISSIATASQYRPFADPMTSSTAFAMSAMTHMIHTVHPAPSAKLAGGTRGPAGQARRI